MITSGKNKNQKKKFPALPNGGRVGGAGGLGFVTGTAVKAAKGAIGLIKNVIGKNAKAFSNTTKQYSKLAKTKKVPIVGKPGKTTTVPKSSKTKKVSYANPRISGRTKSKPVDFKGPNPANKTGAGGNSYSSETPTFSTIQSAWLKKMK